MSLNIFKSWRKRRRRNRWHFILDISLSILILILLVVLFTLNFYQPKIDSPFGPSRPIVVEPEITDPLAINFFSSGSAIKTGSGLLLDLEYYNFGSEEIKEIEVSFEPLSSGFSLNNVQSLILEKDSQIVGKNLLINNLAPEEGGQASLKVYISRPADPYLRQSAWRVIINFDYQDKSFSQEHVLSNVRFLSDTEVKARAYYHSLRGDQLGIGPIPPIVAIPTSYWVFFEVENLGNDLEDFLVSGRLPIYANLGEKKTLLAGHYSYNEENRLLVWQVPAINRSGGSYRAGFEIKITPEEEHIGQVLNLIDNLSYRFNDSLCHEEITGVLSTLNTDLVHDFINQGQGTVLE